MHFTAGTGGGFLGVDPDGLVEELGCLLASRLRIFRLHSLRTWLKKKKKKRIEISAFIENESAEYP